MYVWNGSFKGQNVLSIYFPFFSLFTGIGQNWVKLLYFLQNYLCPGAGPSGPGALTLKGGRAIMPGLGTSNRGTGHCREAQPHPRGAEIAFGTQKRQLSEVVSMTRYRYGLDERSLGRLKEPVILAAHCLRKLACLHVAMGNSSYRGDWPSLC